MAWAHNQQMWQCGRMRLPAKEQAGFGSYLYHGSGRPFLMRKARKIHMHQTMFPLLIVNILENHATKEKSLSITEITQFVNREFGPFAMEKEQLMNRSTVTRILDAMEFCTGEGNLLNFKVTQCGSENKKLFCLENIRGTKGISGQASGE